MVPSFLLIIGILLIVLNVKAIKKSNHNDSFQHILKTKEEDLKDFDFKLGEIRREYAENITELQREIVDLKNNIENVTKTTKKNETADDIVSEDLNVIIKEEKNEILRIENKTVKDEENEKVQIEKNKIVEIDKVDSGTNGLNEKTTKVKELIEQGKSDDEICSELGFGKGEILLIKGLLKY